MAGEVEAQQRVSALLDTKRARAGESTRQFEERRRLGSDRVQDQMEKEEMLMMERLEQVRGAMAWAKRRRQLVVR